MAGRCRQCGRPTEWAPDVGSDVCTSCGTLADPSQSVLTSHVDFPNDASTRDYASLPYTRPTALKSLRGTAGWLLAGQGKEATHDRNKIALHESIRTLAVRLAHPGIAPRAQALFDLALHRASLRWGRPAKLAAGAAVLFALREAGCPDATPDLAYLLSETPMTLTRALTRLLALLSLRLPRALPTTHIPALTAHLIALLSSSSSSASSSQSTTPAGAATGTNSTPTTAAPALPVDLQAFLRPMVPDKLPAVQRTAAGLFDLLALPAPQPAPAPSAPTSPSVSASAEPAPNSAALAPALVILALEAHAAPPRAAPHVQALAGALGARLGAGAGAGAGSVMERYRGLVDLVERAKGGVPWLGGGGGGGEKGGAKGIGKGGGKAKKVGRRTEVARAVVDVVQFRGEVWRRGVRGGGVVDVRFGGEGDAGAESGDEESVFEAVGGETGADLDATRSGKRKLRDEGESAVGRASSGRAKKPKPKRPRTAHDLATAFLLNPLSVSAPSRTTPASSSPAPPDTAISLAHTAHLLAPDAALDTGARARAPTRLQLLAVARGSEARVRDEELFAEGELEELVVECGREQEGDEARRQVLLGIWGPDLDGARVGAGQGAKGGKDREGGKGVSRKGRGRVDMDALARILGDAGGDGEEWGEGEDEGDDDGEMHGLGSWDGAAGLGGLVIDADGEFGVEIDGPGRWAGAAGLGGGAFGAEEEIVEEWRPASPGGGAWDDHPFEI